MAGGLACEPVSAAVDEQVEWLQASDDRALSF